MANFIETRRILPFKGDLPPDKIKVTWTRADQFEAVKRGYYVARADDRHAWVVILNGSQFKDDTGVMASEDKNWRTTGDPHALKLCQFVAQQDWHKCAGAWESPSIAVLNSPNPRRMRWFKAYAEANDPDRNPELKRNQGGRPHGPTGYAMPRYIRRQPDTTKGMARAREADRERRLRSKYGVSSLTPAERTANRLAGVAKRQEIARLKREKLATMAADYYAMRREEHRMSGSNVPFKTWLRRITGASIIDTDPA
jgi:hypothetical protein